MKRTMIFILLLLLIPAILGAWEQNQRFWSMPWSWKGPVPNARIGYSVSAGGDLNHDDIADIAFSAPFDSSGGSELGTIYVAAGNSDGWQPEQDVTTATVASFKGEASGDHPGWSVAIVPSINGDTYDDLIIGAPDNDEAGSDAGKIYIFFGDNTWWGHDVSLATADASFIGEAAGNKAGHIVASAGDVNNDGKNDFIIGAPFAGSGRVYLILGKNSGWNDSVSLSSADAIFIGENDQFNLTRAGFSISGVADLNGDNRDEILIGAPKYSPDFTFMFIGKAYLVLGKATGWSQNDTLSNADYSFLGSVAGDELGTTVAYAGDIDDDNTGDFLVSSPVGTGNVYAFLGTSVGSWGDDTPITSADVRMIGASASTGDAMAMLGDVDGDGIDDFGIGAPDFGAGYGKAYAILGRTTWPSEIQLENSEGGWQGVGHKDWAGRSITGGDVNDDGLADLIVGVDGSPFAGFDAGLVYGMPSNYGADQVAPAAIIDLTATYDLNDHATLSWTGVTVDELGGAEETLFYRVLRFHHKFTEPVGTFVRRLPSVIHPTVAISDTVDVLGEVDDFYYYHVFSVDTSGNMSVFSNGTGEFDYSSDIP